MPSEEESDLSIRALRDPSCMAGWTPRQFELMLRQATRANVLRRIGTLVEAHGLADRIPAGLAAQFEGGRILLRSHRDEVLREAEFIRRALAPLDTRVVLLKGAAYLMADLPAARGRLFTDIDILVPRAKLDAVEGALKLHGWIGTHEDSPYDQRYYRQWMHELPPMVHALRETALDVHHGITPLTARWRAPSEPLIADALALPGFPGLFVLSPADMVLHSMVHLLMNDDLSQGLRDVSDLDQLLRHFGRDPAFWPALVARAERLSLQRALHHGLWCVSAVLQTPIPPATLAAVAPWGPGIVAKTVLVQCWKRALRSPHPSCSGAMSSAALFLLYLRAHWLRMPPLMLVRHLSIKALKLHEPRKAAPDTVKVGKP